MRTKACLITFALVLLPLVGTNVSSKPLFQKEYAAFYPGSAPMCKTCHTVKAKLNAYGISLKKALKGGKAITPAMFKASEAKRPKS